MGWYLVMWAPEEWCRLRMLIWVTWLAPSWVLQLRLTHGDTWHWLRALQTLTIFVMAWHRLQLSLTLTPGPVSSSLSRGQPRLERRLDSEKCDVRRKDFDVLKTFLIRDQHSHINPSPHNKILKDKIKYKILMLIWDVLGKFYGLELHKYFTFTMIITIFMIKTVWLWLQLPKS